MAARIVLATAGSFGDLFPTLGLAIGLRARGYAAVVATSRYYRPLVEGQGLDFHEIGPDLDPTDPGLLARVMDPHSGTAAIVRDLVVPALRESYADLRRACQGADLVLSHPITFAAPLAAEGLGIPWLSTVLAPSSFFSVFDFPALPPHPGLVHLTQAPWVARLFKRLAERATQPWIAPVSTLRRELGLREAGHPLFDGQFSSLGTLALFSSVVAGAQPDWPPQTTITGFVFYDRHGALAPELEAFLDRGEPPIVFTLGSSAVGAARSFYQESARAAVALGRRAVLLVGRHEANRADRMPHPGILDVDYAPHHLLFPRAAAIVHHGGIGTTAQALRAGRPMLVVPHAHDQFDNARRVARLGVAAVVDARRYTAKRAAQALQTLLRPDPLRHAARLAQRIQAEDGVAMAGSAIAQNARVTAAGGLARPGGSGPGDNARMHRIWATGVLAAALLTAPVTVRGQMPASFAARVQALSEPSGYFDTDDLVSNERSYLHVVPALQRADLAGAAYIGVGPDTSFSYIAQTRPSIAFIIDIRRDNLLLHLLFKALFAESPTRIGFLSALLGRAPPATLDPWRTADLARVIDYVDRAPTVPAGPLKARLDTVLAGFGVPLSAEDRATIDRFHQTFVTQGFWLKLEIFGRGSPAAYPTLRELLLETDQAGHRWSYLASEDDYQFVRTLESHDLVIPVVGDLAGPSALRNIGRLMAERGVTLGAFYASNVEFYLFREATFGAYTANLAQLPHDAHSVIIRSVFPSGGAGYLVPMLPGYGSASLVGGVTDLLQAAAAGRVGSYADLLARPTR